MVMMIETIVKNMAIMFNFWEEKIKIKFIYALISDDRKSFIEFR